jgi:hypothetical protein
MVIKTLQQQLAKHYNVPPSLIVAAQLPLATPSPAASIPIKDTQDPSLHKVQLLTGIGKSLSLQR